MGAVDTTYTFTATDTITSTKMNNIIDQTIMHSDAIIGTTLEVTTGKLKVRSQGITSNELAAGAVTPSSTTFADSLLPSGAVMAFARNSAPSGWLVADGSSISTGGSNAALFAAIGYTYGGSGGSFNLPDLRGIFVRGSGSQTIDGITYNKTFASKEGDAFQGHKHEMQNATQVLRNVGGGFNYAIGPNVSFSTLSVGGATTDAINGTPRTSSETRPANIALLYCIKL